MSFKPEHHDVTCLCALVDLPKRVIVEERPPGRGLARFRLQAFTSGPRDALLRLMQEEVAGGEVRRGERGALFVAEIAVAEGQAFRDRLRVLEGARPEGLMVAAFVHEAFTDRFWRAVGSVGAGMVQASECGASV